MAIKNLAPRLAECGKIKIGGLGKEITSKNGVKFRPPVRFNHFVITTTEKDKEGNFIHDNSIMDALGKEPKEIQIKLLFDDIDMNFHTSYQYYHGRKCVCKGDGEFATRKSLKDGSVSQVKCEPEKCEYMQSNKCKVSGILSCLLTKFPSFGGCYRYRTHGWNAVNNILAALEFFKSNTNGILQGLPLKLVMLKKSTEEHGNVNTVSLILDTIELAEMRKLAVVEYENRKALGVNITAYEKQIKSIGFLNDTDKEEDVADEYYPENEPEVITHGVSSDQAVEKLEAKQEVITPHVTENKNNSEDKF